MTDSVKQLLAEAYLKTNQPQLALEHGHLKNQDLGDAFFEKLNQGEGHPYAVLQIIKDCYLNIENNDPRKKVLLDFSKKLIDLNYPSFINDEMFKELNEKDKELANQSLKKEIKKIENFEIIQFVEQEIQLNSWKDLSIENTLAKQYLKMGYVEEFINAKKRYCEKTNKEFVLPIETIRKRGEKIAHKEERADLAIPFFEAINDLTSLEELLLYAVSECCERTCQEIAEAIVTLKNKNK